MLDPQQLIDDLISAGLPRGQAERVARILGSALSAAPATRGDIAQLRKRTDQLHAELLQLRGELRGGIGHLRAGLAAREERTRRRIRNAVMVVAVIVLVAGTALILHLSPAILDG